MIESKLIFESVPYDCAFLHQDNTVPCIRTDEDEYRIWNNGSPYAEELEKEELDTPIFKILGFPEFDPNKGSIVFTLPVGFEAEIFVDLEPSDVVKCGSVEDQDTDKSIENQKCETDKEICNEIKKNKIIRKD